jgi:hypothetical protein
MISLISVLKISLLTLPRNHQKSSKSLEIKKSEISLFPVGLHGTQRISFYTFCPFLRFSYKNVKDLLNLKEKNNFHLL